MDMGENEPVESGRLSSFHVYFHLTRPIEAVVAFRGHPLSHFWYHLHLKRQIGPGTNVLSYWPK